MNIHTIYNLIPKGMVKAFWERQDESDPHAGSLVHYRSLKLHIVEKIEYLVLFPKTAPYKVELKHFVEDAGWNYYEWRKYADAWRLTAELINRIAEEDEMVKCALKRAGLSMRAYNGNPWSVEFKFF